jgi:Icc-related predicted phosphoesterase
MQGPSGMRAIYTSDLHGNLELYRAAGDAAQDWGADAVILGGDLCPGTPSASSRHLPSAQPQFLLGELAPLLETWRRARAHLRVLAIPGNDDCQTVIPALEEIEARGLIENLHRRETTLGNYTLVGLAFVPPTPFSLKDFERRDSRGDPELSPQFARGVLGTQRGFKTIQDFDAYLDSLPTIEEELGRLPAGDPARTIAVVHCPPFGTRCDVLFDGRHIGSKALRRWIEERQPLLALHGHIHESPRLSGAYFDRVGSTTVINPGCDHSRPHLVFIDLENLAELRHSVYT